MSHLVRQKPPPLLGVGRIAAGAEHDVLACTVCASAGRLGGRCRRRVVMHTHIAQVLADKRLELAADRRLQRMPTAGVEHGVNLGRSLPERVRDPRVD